MALCARPVNSGVRRLAEIKLMEESGSTFIQPNYWQQKRRMLIAAAIFSVLIAPSMVIFREGSAPARLFDVISIVGYGVLVLGWCYYDSLERNKPLGNGFRVLIVLFGVLALFIYLIKSQGLKRGLLYIGVTLLVCAGMLLIMGISAWVAALIFGIE